MPTKKETITDEERAKRIRETAKELETSNDSVAFESALKKIAAAPVIDKSKEKKR